MEDAIIKAIIESKIMELVRIGGFGYSAPSCRYKFDKLEIEAFYNGTQSYNVIVNGQKIGTLNRDAFDQALKVRKENLVKRLMEDK